MPPRSVSKYRIRAALRGRSIVLYELPAKLSYGIPPFVVVAVFFYEQNLIRRCLAGLFDEPVCQNSSISYDEKIQDTGDIAAGYGS